MASNKGTRLKEPHAPADISKLEDEVAQISQDLRSIRLKMAEKDLPSLSLMTGTFRYYLQEMQQFVKDWDAEFEKQLIVRRAEAERERKRKENGSRPKKR